MMQYNRFTPLRFLLNRCMRRSGWCFSLCVVCLPVMMGCASQHSSEEEASEGSPVPVRATKVQLTTLRPSIDLVGTLIAIPERTAIIAAQIEGHIQTVSVVEGAIVKSGQTLLQLDTRQIQADQQRAQAVVNQQQAILDRLKNGYLPQEIEIAKQEAQRAKAELDSMRERVEAARSLRKNNEISEVEFKKLNSMLQRDEAAYAAAAARLDLYMIGTRPEAIAEAQAQLDMARSELVRANLDLSFGNVTSPLDGVVTQWLGRRGMHVAQADPLATVVDLSQVFVQIRVPSGYLSSVKLGARAKVSIRSLREESYEGEITRFSGDADPNTGDVQAFATLENKEGLLRPGLACRVSVWLPPIENALVVPVSAVADREGTSILHVVRDNKAYEVEVSLGSETRDTVQITDGLSVNDVVITQGGYGLPEGCPVSVSDQ